MFRASQCPSSGARQTAVAASGFRMNVQVDVFSAVVGLLVTTTVLYKSVVSVELTIAIRFRLDIQETWV
jgi:hypothetical protein